MTRHYLGITARGPEILRNIRRADTGEPLLLIDQDAIARLTVDFTDWLETGETISSVSVSARNCSVSTSTSGAKASITISNVTSANDGEITLIASASSGEKYRGIVRVRRTNRENDEAPHRGDYV